MIKTLSNNISFLRSMLYISALVILVVGALTYRSITEVTKSSEMITHTYKVNVELEQILSNLKDAETGQRGYIITNDSIFLEPYIVGRSKINNSFAELKALTTDNSVLKDNLIDLNVLINKRLLAFQTSYRSLPKNDIDDPNFISNFRNGKVLMDSIRDKIKGVITLQNNLLDKRNDAYKSDLMATPLLLFSLLLCSLLLMYAAYNNIYKNIKRLKASNEELEIFKESTNQSEIVSKHGSWTWNAQTNTFTYSDNLYRLLGEQPQSFESTIDNFMKYVHPEDVDQLKEQVEQMREDAELPYIYYRVVHKNGNIKHLKAYGKSLVNDDDETVLLGTTADITDEITSFRVLEERNAELERNNKELSSFNYVASHDLQEPLRKIQTFLSRLEDEEAEKLSEKGLKYINRIQNAATRMRSLIDDLLQFSRSNKADKVFEDSNVNLLLEAAKQDLAEIISSEHAEITSDAFPTMTVIPFQIQQLFVNLLGNSIKYKIEGQTPKITITHQIIEAEKEDPIIKPKKPFYHKIVFTDNGIGFDNQYAEQIFTLFSRLHNKDEYSGTGIGLSICKKIVENHKGYITASGQPGKGAIFTVYLPID
ncbi:sensor histidine kinase [Psychroserpens sp. NJDZ02]|uniref:sensor histidine kinase n=1 Tax=Psychroserpens sp. NJDZ02 TaxID=2570561 RepID=UPI0010A8EBFF|nr:CHASE3 domain-containing protein [Psychroserpens sp. NJDZ02]QCE41013.1 PAS domain S-box protein [Psychroserpens sp. NJDZ02]